MAKKKRKSKSKPEVMHKLYCPVIRIKLKKLTLIALGEAINEAYATCH